MSCLSQILSIRGICDDYTSTSGLDLMDAPEITTKTAAAIASEGSWKQLVKDKYNQACILVRNDLVGALAANKAMANVNAAKYQAAVFKQELTYPAENKDRGLILYRNNRIKGKLRKTVIHKIKLFPLSDKSGAEIKVITDYPGDGVGTEYTYTKDLIGGQLNEIEANLTLPAPFSYAKVLVNGTDLSMASSFLTCFTGCNGTLPNDCGYVKGFSDGKEISGKEGFGVSIEFGCECDYDDLLCDMSKSVMGEIVYLKTRVLLLEEHLRTDRLNNVVVYAREETKDFLVDLENQYRGKWNDLMSTLPNILRQHRDDCIICNGTRWVTNI